MKFFFGQSFHKTILGKRTSFTGASRSSDFGLAATRICYPKKISLHWLKFLLSRPVFRPFLNLPINQTLSAKPRTFISTFSPCNPHFTKVADRWWVSQWARNLHAVAFLPGNEVISPPELLRFAILCRLPSCRLCHASTRFTSLNARKLEVP